MRNIIIEGYLTSTTDKGNDKFKQEVPTKTAYITVPNTDEQQKLEEFGVNKYTTKDGKNNFFIIKLPQQVAIVKGNTMKRITGKAGSPNFSTPENKLMKFNIIEGEKMGNKFYRLQAILVDDDNDIEYIQMENPFGEGYLKEETQENVTPDINDEDLPF